MGYCRPLSTSTAAGGATGTERLPGPIEDAARRGYVAATITYRLSDPDSSGKPKNPFPAQIEDVKCAVRWLRANAEKYHVDPNRIGATGGSAGGHLSLLVGVTVPRPSSRETAVTRATSRVQAVVKYFGPTDLPRLHKSSRGGRAARQPVGRSPRKRAALYKAASPITYVSKDDPPTLTIHGTADPVVPVEQATEFDAAMRKAGASHTHVAPWREARFAGNQTAREATFKFFDEHLKKNG